MSDLSPDCAHIERHLDLLFKEAADSYPDELIQIQCLHPNKQPPQMSYFKSTDRIEAARYAYGHNQSGYNAYVGVNLRKRDTKGNATNEDVETAFYQFADFDDKESAEKFYQSLDKPAGVFKVITGEIPHERFHIYHKLLEACTDMTSWSRAQMSLTNFYGSDVVKDPRRIMRLAGTVSYPTPKKAAKGYQVSLVKIDDGYQGGPPISQDDLNRSFPPPETKADAKPSDDSQKFEGPADEDVVQNILNGYQWHNNMLSLTAKFVRRGLCDKEILLFAPLATRPGYTLQQTIQQMQKMIDPARIKWGMPNNDIDNDEIYDFDDPLNELHNPVLYTSGTIVAPSRLHGCQVPPREWLIEGIIPQSKVLLFTGDGGLGKSLLMQQLLTCVATGTDWLGMPVKMGKAFGLFCEDSNEELHRRQQDINSSLNVNFQTLEDMRWISFEGKDAMLMQFDNNAAIGKLTGLYISLIEKLKEFAPRLVVIDTLADTFGGNEIMRSHVRAFINMCLARICKETGATVILCGHPSAAGMRTGEGYSGSTAWNNSVRSRLYLSKMEEEKGRIVHSDERILSTKKQNYGASNGEFRIRWVRGAFELVSSKQLKSETAAIDAENAYLAAFKALSGRGLTAHPAKNQTDYAPKAMMRLPETNGFSFKELENAQERLYQKGVIKVDTSGPASRQKRKIIIAGVDPFG